MLGSWGCAKGLAVLCLKANCKCKASSTCFCCSSHAAFPCNATTMSSWDTVTMHVAREPAGTQGHMMPLGNARASQAEGLEQGTVALLALGASHLLPPVPPVAASAPPAAKNVLPAVL